jgi:penicillin G amidase
MHFDFFLPFAEHAITENKIWLMKIIRKILTWLALLLVVLALGALVFLYFLKRSGLPDYAENVKLNGLSGEVTIYRDSLAIPHVYAKNEADLYRAVGFVMAQDRLWQMDLLRRVTMGRLSEIFGADMVETDLLLRSLRIPEKSARLLENIDPDVKTALDAFSDGINQYISNNQLPPEFRILGYKPEPWKPEYSINLIGYMAWDLSSGWGEEMLLYQLQKFISREQLNDLIPDLKKQTTPVVRDFEASGKLISETFRNAELQLESIGAVIFSGSNNWAVSPQKSSTGQALLANDMHLGLAIPGIWYQMHQVAEGKLNVTGVVLPGAPLVICGHNDSIAWGMTNVMVDDLDFYRETLNSDSTRYYYDNGWHDLKICEETIKIKGGGEKKLKLRYTHRGPIINRFNNIQGDAISFHWLGNELSNEMLAVYRLDRAHNWSDFRDAVKTFISVSQNIVYADVRGNIGLQTSAGIPLREGTGITIYPGDTSRYDWKGIVPFEQLPFEFNPSRGYVSSANNKTVPDSYPYYISHWFAQPFRIDRIREMLEEKEKLSPEDFMKMQADSKSKLVSWILPQFLESLQQNKFEDKIHQKALEILEKWDGQLTVESPAAAIFDILYRRVFENLIKDDLPGDLFKKVMGNRDLLENMLKNILPAKTPEWIDDKSTPQKETFSDIVVRAFKETTTELDSLAGNNPDEWAWGRIHTFMLEHPMGSVKILDKLLNLNRGPFPVQGSFHTVCPYSYSFNNLYKANNGASERHVFNTGNWDASKTVIPTGESGIPASPYYCNQTKLYIQNRYHNDNFTKEAVKKAVKFEMKLIPE